MSSINVFKMAQSDLMDLELGKRTKKKKKSQNRNFTLEQFVSSKAMSNCLHYLSAVFVPNLKFISNQPSSEFRIKRIISE